MKLTVRAVPIALTAFAWATPVRGQESVFNLPIPGVPATGESVRARGLGGAAGGLTGETFSMENPAWISGFDRAGLYLSLLGQQTTAEDRVASGDFDDVVFPMGQAVVPAFGAVIGAGYYQFLDFDAAIESSVVFEGDTVPVGLDSEGGVGVLAPSLAYAIDARTSAGVSLDVYLGSREVVRSLTVPGALATRDTLARDFGGMGLTLGAIRALGARAWLGVAYRIRPDLDSEITRAGDPDLIDRGSKVRVPNEVLIDTGVKLSERLGASVAVRYAGWEGSLAGDLANDGALSGDAWEAGGGIEYAPENPVAFVIGPEAPLRLGYRWKRLPVRIDGQAVDEWSLALGYSRSFGTLSRVDVALEYGRRGDLDKNGLTERYGRLAVGMAVFEMWRRFD